MENLEEGMRITLSASPSIQVERYHNLKPHASITVTLSDDVSGDVDRAKSSLERLLYESLVVELGVLSDMAQVIADSDSMEDVVQYCMEKSNGETTIKKEAVEVEKDQKESRTKARRRKSKKDR